MPSRPVLLVIAPWITSRGDLFDPGAGSVHRGVDVVRPGGPDRVDLKTTEMEGRPDVVAV